MENIKTSNEKKEKMFECLHVGCWLRFKHRTKRWCHMKNYALPKHVKRVPVQTPIKTRRKCGDCDQKFTKRTTITGITRTFTQDKFPR